MLAGKTVVVGITVGVAAHYKPELIGQLRYRPQTPVMHDTMGRTLYCIAIWLNYKQPSIV
jgi:hypothetical protein